MAKSLILPMFGNILTRRMRNTEIGSDHSKTRVLRDGNNPAGPPQAMLITYSLHKAVAEEANPHRISQCAT
jgi:hypothetical protein